MLKKRPALELPGQGLQVRTTTALWQGEEGEEVIRGTPSHGPVPADVSPRPGTLSNTLRSPLCGGLVLPDDPRPAKECVCIFSILLSASYLTRV